MPDNRLTMQHPKQNDWINKIACKRIWKKKGVFLINAVAVYFDTDMTGKLSRKNKRINLNQIVLGCMASPEDIARAVAFLSVEENRCITDKSSSVRQMNEYVGGICERRVVITGMGAKISPLGNDVTSLWTGAKRRMQISEITRFHYEGQKAKFAGEAVHFRKNYFDQKVCRRMDRVAKFGIYCIKRNVQR